MTTERPMRPSFVSPVLMWAIIAPGVFLEEDALPPQIPFGIKSQRSLS
jgi:hypothetical protein